MPQVDPRRIRLEGSETQDQGRVGLTRREVRRAPELHDQPVWDRCQDCAGNLAAERTEFRSGRPDDCERQASKLSV